MFRRRRRRSRFSSGTPLNRVAILGVAGAVLVGGFVFFFVQADSRAPEPREMRIELPDAFK